MRPDGEVRWCVGHGGGDASTRAAASSASAASPSISPNASSAEERQNLLAREVDHRAKNALALAQSIVRLTRGAERRAPTFRSVEGRINALARVHTILSLSSWQGAEIRRLVDEELAPYFDGRPDHIARFGGSACSLRRRKRVALALARTRHQFGEVWRPLHAVRPPVH